MRAVEGMAGAAVIYTAFAVILTCFLGGVTFFAFLALLLDLAFMGCFIAIAVLTRGGARSCSGRNVPSPIETGNSKACKLETTVFAVAIIAAYVNLLHISFIRESLLTFPSSFLFLVSALMAVLLSRQHKKEKRFGPGPSNDYTSGSGKKAPFWKRKNNKTHDAELGAVGAGGLALAEEKHHHHKNGNIRPSHDTAMTGSTAAGPDHYGSVNNKYDREPTVPAIGTAHTPHHTPHYGTATSAPNAAYCEPTTGSTPVVHDPEPYAPVHHGGFPHTHPESEELGFNGRAEGYGSRPANY